MRSSIDGTTATVHIDQAATPPRAKQHANVPDDTGITSDVLQAVWRYRQRDHDADLERIAGDVQALLDPLVAVVMDIDMVSRDLMVTAPTTAQYGKLTRAQALLSDVIHRLRDIVVERQIPADTDVYATVEALAVPSAAASSAR